MEESRLLRIGENERMERSGNVRLSKLQTGLNLTPVQSGDPCAELQRPL